MELKFTRRVALHCFIGWLLISPSVLGATIAPVDYRPDQILIQPKPGVSGAALAAFHAAQGSSVTQTFAAAGGAQVITVPSGETVPDLIKQYQASGLVTFAEPDYLVHADATMPNDPKFLDGTLWGLNNYGQNGGTAGADISAPAAWDILTSASNIVVAVLDSGIRATHEDLAANMWVNPNDGGHGFNAFTGTNDPADDSGSHGTMVAGILGAVGNNGKGITGVAWQVRMMACKCLDNGTGSDATVIACVDYALANGARIINASFDSPDASLALSNAVVAARDAGVIWVASAGNSSNASPGRDVDVAPSYPSCYGIDNIISVAYTTRTDDLGHLSNYGATNVALAAPGDQIYTTFAASDSFYYPPSGLGINIAGTSFAAPCVSGALALMLAKYPTENYHQIIQRLLNATDPLPALAGKCVTGGRLNLAKALNPPIWLTSVATTDAGRFQLRLSTGANRECVIQTSTDLAGWTPVYTNTTAPDGTFDFTNSLGSPAQFFRAVAAP
jgi:subtilisin family serine protease